jgi:hypothetical protein
MWKMKNEKWKMKSHVLQNLPTPVLREGRRKGEREIERDRDRHIYAMLPSLISASDV